VGCRLLEDPTGECEPQIKQFVEDTVCYMEWVQTTTWIVQLDNDADLILVKNNSNGQEQQNYWVIENIAGH
jgi:hypothetical protein